MSTLDHPYIANNYNSRKKKSNDQKGNHLLRQLRTTDFSSSGKNGKEAPSFFDGLWTYHFVTASPESYNHLLSLGSTFPLQLKEIKAVSPTQFAGEQPVFLPPQHQQEEPAHSGFETIPDLWPKGSTGLGSLAFQLRKVADLWLGKQAVTSTHCQS